MKIILLVSFFLVSFSVVKAAEIDELRKELAVIQSQMNEERALYQAAKASMERSDIVAKYLFPQLQAKERELTGKIQKIEIDDAAKVAQSQKDKQ